MIDKSTMRSPGFVTLVVLFLASVLSLIFMKSLVAEPKVLFGRSLSAIPPGLFPQIVLGLLAVLSAGALFTARKHSTEQDAAGMGRAEWVRVLLLFAILVLYAVTMSPFGFLISGFVAIVLVSLLMGARSVFQILPLALISPVLLYLGATRLLAVSLPELNSIELFYARLLS